jgi:hypothetical protein
MATLDLYPPVDPRPAGEIYPQLARLEIEAPHHTKTGEIRLKVLKAPRCKLEDTNEDKEVVEVYNKWWKESEWFRMHPTKAVLWNSTARTSDIWTRFKEAADALTGQPFVYCLRCGYLLTHSVSIGSKHMANHSNSAKCRNTNVYVHAMPDTPYRLPLSRPGPPIFTQNAFERELVRVVIDNNWSFRTVERPSFQNFIKFLRPAVSTSSVITTRYKFRGMFTDQWAAAQSAALSDLGKNTKISIALDGWAAQNHLSFLAINGYYINDNWELKEVLLDFIPQRGSHSGEAMARAVTRALSAKGYQTDCSALRVTMLETTVRWSDALRRDSTMRISPGAQRKTISHASPMLSTWLCRISSRT